MQHSLRDIDPKVMQCSLHAQGVDITGALGSNAEILADDERARGQPIHQDAFHERFWRHPGQSRIESETQKLVHPALLIQVTDRFTETG